MKKLVQAHKYVRSQECCRINVEQHKSGCMDGQLFWTYFVALKVFLQINYCTDNITKIIPDVLWASISMPYMIMIKYYSIYQTQTVFNNSSQTIIANPLRIATDGNY